MDVPLHLVLVILLALSQAANGANTNKTRLTSISSSSSSPILSSIKNTTEINNRDLNKITTDNPKTEILESKLESIIDKVPRHQHDDVPIIQSNHTKKETNDTEEIQNDPKEKHREDNGKAISGAAAEQPFWRSEYHLKNSVFTLPSNDSGKFSLSQETKDFFITDTKSDLTTPKIELFDQKFKETVDSVDQKLEEIDRNHADDSSISRFHDEEDKDDTDFHMLDDLPVMKSTPEKNHTMEYHSAKLIVSNETSSDKNWIHKNLNIERIKRINYETTYNDTTSYGEESTTKNEISTEKIFSTLKPVSQKPFLHKEEISDKINSHILSNKIETESSEPIKVIVTSTTTPASTTQKNTINTVENVRKVPYESTNNIHESTTPKIQYVSDSENQVIPETPLPFSKKNSVIHQEEEEEQKLVLPKITVIASTTLPSINISKALNTTETTISDGTTEPLSTIMENKYTEENSTELPSTTTQLWEATSEIEKTTIASQNDVESTTIVVPEDISAVTTSSASKENTTETIQRTSKSLDNFIDTDEEINSIETTTIIPSTTFRFQSDSTSMEHDQESSITTTDVPATTTNFGDAEDTTTDQPTTIQSSSRSTTVLPTDPVTSTEYTASIQIDDNEKNQTTLLPEYLNPHFSYGTQASTVADASDVVIVHDKTFPRNNGTTVIMDSSTRMNRVYVPTARQSSSDRLGIKITTQNLLTRLMTTMEDSTESIPTEDSYTKDNEDGASGKIAAIVISSVGAVCLVVLAGLLYVMKKRQKRLNYGPRCRPVSLDDYSIDNLSVYNSVMRKTGSRLSKRSFGNPAFEDPTGPTHPLNFPALAKFSTNIEDIKGEYSEIPQISAKTSELPDGCETKNRYANVIPLPETRVFLKSIEGYPNSDYINANYVTGAKSVRKYYIAAQGPMQNTVDDFWRMIWEQNVKVILMLTHLIENGFEKCADYLPKSEIVDCNRSFGDFQITMKKREVKEKYIISILQLKNMVSNSWREVTHFWYLGWPEKGVPNEANSLIAFLIEARSYMKTNTLDKKDTMNGTNIQNGNRTTAELNPVVVHCSPGTGRTGVAIACDIAIREFETSRLVDIPKIVYRMRRDRAGAVQTREQYQFIYRVVSLYATKLTGGALENF